MNFLNEPYNSYLHIDDCCPPLFPVSDQILKNLTEILRRLFVSTEYNALSFVALAIYDFYVYPREIRDIFGIRSNCGNFVDNIRTLFSNAHDYISNKTIRFLYDFQEFDSLQCAIKLLTLLFLWLIGLKKCMWGIIRHSTYHTSMLWPNNSPSIIQVCQ